MKVSIVITNYNYSKFLGDCIGSCLNQSYKDMEIVVVDDASTDGSQDYLNALADKHDALRVVCLKGNGGYAHAKNEGILRSRGEWIAFLDADDMLTPKSLGYRVRGAMEHGGVGLVHGYCLKCHNNESYSWCCENINGLERHKSFLHAQGIMVKRDVFDKFGLFYEGLRSKADKEMWYRLGVHKDSPLPRRIKSLFIEKPMAFYRRHPEAMHKMRVVNKEYNDKIEAIFSDRIMDLQKNGITKDNTRFA